MAQVREIKVDMSQDTGLFFFTKLRRSSFFIFRLRAKLVSS